MQKQLTSYLVKRFNIDKALSLKAIKEGQKAMEQFQEILTLKGKEILASLKGDKYGVVIAGRPYQNDELISHHLSRHFTRLGIPVLTLDAFDLGDYEIEKARIEIYNAVHARMLSGTMAVAHNPNLEMAQIVSFGCGHDAIICDEMNRIMGELSNKSILQIKLDEGEVEGPIKIRVRSFIETINARRKSGSFKIKREDLPVPFPVKFTKEDKYKRRILAPNLSPAFSLLATKILEKLGYTAEKLPLANERAFELGKRYVNNDICFPAQINIGEFLHHMENHPEDQSKLSLGLAKNCENCRAGQYPALARKALDEAGYPGIPIVTTGDDNKEMHPGFRKGIAFQVNMVWGMAMVDRVEAMLRAVRPYEINPGETLKVYQHYLESVTESIKGSREHALEEFRRAVNSFNAIPSDRTHRKPRVGLLGEIFLKYHPSANGYIEEYLNQHGIEVHQPAMMDFFRRDDVIRNEKRRRDMLNNPLMAWLVGRISESVYKTAVARVDKIFQEFKYYESHADAYEMAENVREFMDIAFKVGEGWLIAAELIDLVKHGINNFVIVQPFGCMPNHIAGRGIIKALKNRHPRIQVLSLDFEPDTSRANIENRLQMLIMNTKEREKQTVDMQLVH
jgi:predicted nucleotide-binding protein (sugar kinase/HSP70/actin superfamily)